MTRKRGIKYISYNGTGYCPKCGMWASHELWQSYITTIYFVGSAKHTERIEGHDFTIKRCWY